MSNPIRFDLSQPLPAEMQGRWVDVCEPDSELVVAGSQVSYRGMPVRHDHFVVDRIEGALRVDLGIDDTDLERADSFARENVTSLVVDPEGRFHAYNVKFASQFERAPS